MEILAFGVTSLMKDNVDTLTSTSSSTSSAVLQAEQVVDYGDHDVRDPLLILHIMWDFSRLA